ncbi:E3 ubiquitin-protein ligase listerin [[Candida] railenensis]|uniref:E3 ubiquitin-protein ligase listerin n=1 Tax=[Candida] railenensis TaxID=45579 RepID=A0A9P0QSC0_9ASCO|nr:E3 ubiquitin-protein ligase listerin [[Candida] railenensis]
MFGESNGKGDLGYNGFPISLNYFTALPDPSLMQDANATIIFKSLSKKDAITKEKSLNDLLQYIDSSNKTSVDDNFLMAWLQIYPKLAIDNARNVRILSHQVEAKLLDTLGGKAFSKYLKSSIPIWLLGTFDSDNLVSTTTYKALLQSFQGDTDRVEKVWTLFNDSILNFVEIAIKLETHESLSDTRYTKEDDSVAKYDRVLNGCLTMLTKMIGIYKVNDSEEKYVDQILQIEDLIGSEQLWDRFATCLESKTLNLALFKTLLIVVKVVFSSEAITKHFSNVKSLYKLISKKFLKHIKFKSAKTSTGGVVYSGIILQFWDTLITLTKFPQVAELSGNKIKKNFWELGSSDDKSQERFMNYLKLGHCQSSPTYYNIVGQLILILSSTDSCKFLLTKPKEILQILNVYTNATLPGFREKSLICELKVFTALQEELTEKSIEVLREIIFQVIDSVPYRGRGSDTSMALSKVLANFLAQERDDSESILQPINDVFVDLALERKEDKPLYIFTSASYLDSYIHILESVPLPNVLNSLTSRVVNGLTESPELLRPTMAFTILSKTMPVSSCAEDESNFIETIPSYLESDFVEPPLILFSRLIDRCSSDTINDLFIKLTMCAESKIPFFLDLIKDTVDLNSFPEIMEYINSLSLKKGELSKEEQRIVFKYLENDSTLFDNLFSRATKSKQDGVKFLEALVKKNSSEIVDLDREVLYSICWRNVSSTAAKEILLGFDIETEFVRRSLLEDITSKGNDHSHFSSVAEFVGNGSENFTRFFPYQHILDIVGDSSSHNTDLLSIANPLEQNIYLTGEKELQVSDIAKFILVGKFLLSVSESISHDDLTICAGLISEYLSDHIFLSSIKDDVHDDLIQVQMKLSKLFAERSKTSSLEIFDIVKNGGSGLVFKINDQTTSIYFARLFKRILSNAIESSSIADFEIAFSPIEADLTKMASSSPLKLAVILLSCSKFFQLTKKFDRIRNFLLAEILGVRDESKILADGLKWLSLSINFLNVDSDGEADELLPPHRLGMIINTFSNWLDSSLSYDEAFIPIRALLSRFLAGYLSKFGDLQSTPEKLFELAVQLLEDNLSIISTEPRHLELRYFTFKLLIVVNSKRELFLELWKEHEQSISEGLLEILFSEEINAIDTVLCNQPVTLCHEILSRIFDHYPISYKITSAKLDQLYGLIKSDFIDIQRIGVKLLKEQILVSQQEFVVEYELQKSKIKDENEDDVEKYDAKLPGTLLALINTKFEDYIEFEDPSKVSRYLWSWSLIFNYFEDITYSIRNSYTDVLKKSSYIESLLDFIFQQVDVNDEKILSKLGDIDLTDNSTHFFSSESFITEMKLTLIHLYYLSLEHFGSECSMWYNSIRDRQLKLKIEKFTTKHISPLLTSQILNEVSKSIDKLGSELMTLKVNKTTNEIKSIYAIDDQTMEMVVKIPQLYPLSKVSVEGPLRLGVKENQWKAWLLASQRVISLTNGSIIEAIELFNKNVNYHFSGFEDCAICYSILHQDHSLPSKTCPVCNNKFHAACLYKWFKSSGSSTCPLCRSTFNFTRRS